MSASTPHPWRIFARGASAGADLKRAQAGTGSAGSYLSKIGDHEANSSDEDEDVPTVTPGSTQESLSCRTTEPDVSERKVGTGHFNNCPPGHSGPGLNSRESTWLTGDTGEGELPEWVVHRVEDMIMEHFYRLEASVFKAECAQKAQERALAEQRLRTDEVKEHIFALADSHGADRTRVLDLGRDVTYLLQQNSEHNPKRGNTLSSPAVAAPKAHEERMAELRRDLEAHVSRHEERLDSVERSLSKVYNELFALRRSFDSGTGSTLEHTPTVTGTVKGFRPGTTSPSSLSTDAVVSDKAENDNYSAALGKTNQQPSNDVQESQGFVSDKPAASVAGDAGFGAAVDLDATASTTHPESSKVVE